ncbi:CYP745A1 [Auxenochlorella protothecoides x Auxenochlorella symbiontica]
MEVWDSFSIPTALSVAYALLASTCTLLLLRWLEADRWARVWWATRAIPSAPGNLPLFGHALTLARGCSWGQMYDWVSAAMPVVRFRVGTRTGVIVADPAAFKRIVQTRQRIYAKDTDFSYREFLPILGTGLVTSNGDHWQRQRLLMAPAFRIDMLDTILPIAARAVERLATKLRKHKGTGQPVDMEEEFRLLTLQVIGEAILSLPPEECDRVFPPLYLSVMEESNKRVLQPWRLLWPPLVRRYDANIRALNAYLGGVIERRREARAAARAAGGAPPDVDILDRVLAALEARGRPWTRASATQLCYELKTFLLAGHETSAAMLCWTLYELSLQPELYGEARREAREALPARATPPARAAVEGMTLTLAALKESLRKYSVVPVLTRNLVAPDTLCGYDLPAGSWIVLHVQRVHHLYKDPLAWKPARFMPGGEYEQFDEDIRPYMFMPFIQGPRNCLGQFFALLEARVILGALCREFNFRPVHPEHQGVTHPTVIPVGPVNGMRMYVD